MLGVPTCFDLVIVSVGGIDLELAPQVVTALDDVCVLSPRSFDRASLAALLGEVCLWLVEQRIGPRAQHAKYKSCDPYAQVLACSSTLPVNTGMVDSQTCALGQTTKGLGVALYTFTPDACPCPCLAPWTFWRQALFMTYGRHIPLVPSLLINTVFSLITAAVIVRQVQHKLNRVATASGSANPSVAMSALLDVMADAHTKSAGRQEPEQV